MTGRDRLVERQILKAQAEGKFQGLEGEGRPLAEHPEAAFVSASEAVAFRIMAEAGALPHEITLKKQADALRAHLAELVGDSARKPVMKQLADLEMRQAIAEEARRKFLR